MSFFGFEQSSGLEGEKRKFLEGGLRGAEGENVAVYTWGEDSYDGLGDALQEGGDELNDETFGSTGEVGKDFDFSSHTLSLQERPPVPEALSDRTRGQYQELDAVHLQPIQSDAPSRPAHSLEAIWDDRSPFSVLPKTNGVHRAAEHPAATSPSTYLPSHASNAPLGTPSREPVVLSLANNQSHGVRTLEEIEAEMREAFAAQRNQNISPSQSHVLAQTHRRESPLQRHLTPQHSGTPPPRMHPHAQSPRFHQQQQQHQIHLLQQHQQRQILELQEQRRRQQQIQLLELQERLQLEQAERQRQLRAQQQAQVQELQYLQHQRQSSAGRLTPSLVDLQQRRFGQQSPASPAHAHQQDVPFQQSLQYLPRDIQMQQRLLAEMAQAEFLSSMQASSPLMSDRDTAEDTELQEALRAEAMRKIMEAERMEEKRKRKLEKIRYMSRYNDLMTQSDKDFITRIQVSQLVTQDPYTDDFYAQVYGALMRKSMGLGGPEAVLKFGSGGGVGLGLSQVKGGRRPSAMQRMEAQVERIVNNARLREKEKISLNNLQGALGRTAGRSYKAAPRQLLQVDSGAPNGAGNSPTLSHATPHHISKADASNLPSKEGANAAAEAAKMGKQALGNHDGNALVRKDPLTHRETLVMLERIYDFILDLEQLKREQPSPEDVEAVAASQARFALTVDKIWDALQVMVPLDTSDPHPFISLLTPIKGKKMLPRVTRHFSTQRQLTLLTLLVACFSQLDVVVKSRVLDVLDDTEEREDVDMQTQAFLGSVMQSILPIGATATLRLVSGILGVFLERNDVGVVARSRPGIALLTMFLSRVEVIKQSLSTATDISEIPSAEETEQWQLMYDHLFQLLTPHLVFLFPSVRQSIVTGIPYLEIPGLDVIDQPVWQFLAALALHASVEQQQVLVTSLRERVLENVTSAAKGWVSDEEDRKMRLNNVNIFLHALGLDSSQIAL